MTTPPHSGEGCGDTPKHVSDSQILFKESFEQQYKDTSFFLKKMKVVRLSAQILDANLQGLFLAERTEIFLGRVDSRAADSGLSRS